MSNYPPTSSYGASYGAHDQTNPPYLPPTYPTYMQPDDGRMNQAGMSSNYDASMSAYGYNAQAPTFSASAIASGVPPLPIYQGWNQDSIPLPPYHPHNTQHYNGYVEPPQTAPYYAPPSQPAYQQNTLAPKPYDEGEVSEGEFEASSAVISNVSAPYGSNQYRAENRSSYADNTQRRLYTRAEIQGLQQPYNSANNYNNPSRDSPQTRREQPDAYSPYDSPRTTEQTKQNTHNPHARTQSRNSKNEGSRDQRSGSQNCAPVSSEQYPRTNGHGTPLQSEPVARVASPVQSLSVPVSGTKAVKTVAGERKKAQRAVMQLWPGVRYQTYVDEGVKEDIVGSLFDELKMPRGSVKSSGGSDSENTLSLSSSALTSKQAGGTSFATRNGSSLVAPPPPNANGKQSGANEQFPQNQTNGKQIITTSVSLTKSSTFPVANAVTATMKLAAMSEKERTLQSKMEALRKSREERAQKAAAKNNAKSPTEAGPIQSLPQTQPQISSIAPAPKPVNISPEPIQQATQPQNSTSTVSSQSPIHNTPTQPSLPVIPGLFLASSAPSPAPPINTQSTPGATPLSNQRKRPVAADFDAPASATPFKRPFGHSHNDRPLVIDVSDEEEDSDDEDVAMDIESQADQDSPVQTARKMSDQRSAAIQNLPQLTDFPPRKPFTPPPNSSAASTPPISQTASKAALGRPEVLQRKESEIELLKKKIAEAEAKRKARQTPSGTRTPQAANTPSVEAKESTNSSSNLASKVEASIKIQNLIGIADNKASNDQQKLVEAHAAEDQKAAELKRNEEERKRLRRQKIASDLPLVDAHVQETQNKLEQLRAETARLEAEMQKNLEAKRLMAEEMERLGQEAEEQLQAQKDKLKDLTEGSGSNNAPSHIPSSTMKEDEVRTSLSPTVPIAQEMSPVSTEPPPITTDATGVTDNTTNDASQQEVPLSNETQAFFEGDGDEEPGLSDRPEALPPQEKVPDAKDQILADRALEAALQEAVRAEADSHAHNGDIDMETSFAPDPSQLAPETSSNQAEEETRSPVYSPVLDRTVSDAIDAESDTYEPPEATPPVDAPPTPIESPPFSPAPPDTFPESEDVDEPMQVIDDRTDIGEALPQQNGSAPRLPQNDSEPEKTHFFTPYESPLKQFRAFRFHPNYKQEVPGGLRSLTYSHKIDHEKEFCRYELAGGVCNDSTCDLQHFRDIGLPGASVVWSQQIHDGVLTNLGSPDQFSASQREKFCEGLRAVLTDLRARKIKDFDVIASEIVAHRSKFLGDNSKVLNLEGTTI